MKHLYRLLILLAGSILWVGWVVEHSEPSSNVGLRYIHQAEQIDRGAWRDGLFKGIDHPLHPLAIVAAHRLIGGVGPGAWQQAALLLGFTAVVLLVIPIYLLALELFDDQTAWLACVLVIVNPIMGSVVVNVLSETTFLLWWTWGLWGSVRFLREGRFLWLPLAIGFGALAYLTRPEGMLLLLSLVTALLSLPLLRATRINWPRLARALAFLMGGLVLSSGPYIATKGGLGTKPGVARVLGLAPQAQPLALERERPLPPDQSTFETYRLATVRMLEVLHSAVTPPLFVFAPLGLVLAGFLKSRARAWLLLGIVLTASAVALVRLHATAGYCSVQHGLVPGVLLTLAAAYGLTRLMSQVAIPGHWFGVASARLIPGPAVWAVLIALGIVIPNLRCLGPFHPGPFSAYQEAGHWVAQSAQGDEQVLDLTDWALFFSQRTGYHFADIYQAAADPRTRWVVVSRPHIEGDWHYSRVVRELIGGGEPVALWPPRAGPHQLQIRIYDRQVALAGGPDATRSRGLESLRR
jgi:hypothetical protein